MNCIVIWVFILLKHSNVSFPKPNVITLVSSEKQNCYFFVVFFFCQDRLALCSIHSVLLSDSKINELKQYMYVYLFEKHTK